MKLVTQLKNQLFVDLLKNHNIPCVYICRYLWNMPCLYSDDLAYINYSLATYRPWPNLLIYRHAWIARNSSYTPGILV